MKTLLSLPKKTIDFIKGVISEMKLVEFLSRKETFSNTHMVIAISVAASIFLLLADGLFTYIRNFLIETI